MSCLFQKLLGIGFTILVTGGLGFSAEPLSAVRDRPSNAGTIAAQLTAAQPVSIPFKVCGASQTWVRPTRTEQLKKLQSMSRYSGLNPKELQDLLQRFWQRDIFSFTQYGLSLRMEPVYLSGLWTVQDQLWPCYDSTRVNQINAGKTAEVWVLSHRVTRIQWTGQQYVMVVQPAKTGVQFIQFPRRESQSTLPLSVVTDQGSKLTVVAGN